MVKITCRHLFATNVIQISKWTVVNLNDTYEAEDYFVEVGILRPLSRSSTACLDTYTSNPANYLACQVV